MQRPKRSPAASLYGMSGDLQMLGRGWGAVVLLAYAVLFAVLGRFLTLRRDVS